jgi:hypothetical protein
VVDRVLEQESLKAEDPTNNTFRNGSEWRELESINAAFGNDVLEDGVKFVEDIDPGVEIRTEPLPSGGKRGMAEQFQKFVEGMCQFANNRVIFRQDVAR